MISPEAIEPRSFIHGPIPPLKNSGAAEVQKPELVRRKEHDEVSLGDLNPLIHFPDLGRRESIDAIKKVIRGKITESGGAVPERLESTLVTSRAPNVPPALRFIARFEVSPGQLTEEKMGLLESLVAQTYRVDVRTRTNSEGREVPTESYPPINNNDVRRAKTGGWYMGPNQTATDSLHRGLFVFKDLGEVNKSNFLDEDDKEKKYIVEVREAQMYQTDLVEFITQVSSILGQGEMLDHSELLYEVYYDLIRLGIKKVDPEMVHGMEAALDRIKRGLLWPLANMDLSRGIDQQAESVLLVGSPGTGKTLVARQLLHEETGVFILPLDPLELAKELQADKEKQTILPRIAEVSRSTGKRIVLHIDDIENMVQNKEDTHSTMLNLMAGIRDSGFHILASTNDPEKIDPALLQPQRFGILLHCGLQDEEARRVILQMHTHAQSQELEVPLFDSEEARDIIVGAVASHTENFTPRYIAEIANVAKSHLLARIARTKGVHIGLTEEDIEGSSFTIEDWENAYIEVSSRYDKDGVVKRSKSLEEFVNRHMRREPIGIPVAHNSEARSRIFSADIYDRLTALTTAKASQ